MKAKIEPRINLNNRTRLEEVIPLSTPIILFVDPSNMCNFKCSFCPTGDKNLIKSVYRKQCVMDFNTFKKIIDDIKEFDKPLKVLRLYKEGEPLLNKNLADMIRYAKNSSVVEFIDTTTNGYLLKPEIIKPIIDAGLDKLNISINGMNDEQYFKSTGIKVNFKDYTNNIIDLCKIKGDCEICIKIIGDFIDENDKLNFYNTFGDHVDKIFIENLAPCWPEFDIKNRFDINDMKGIYNQPISETNTCPYIFYMITVNSDGTVSLCFLDWSRKLIIGDVNINSLKEIWEGNELFNYRVSHLSGNIKNNKTCKLDICKKCGQLTHCLPDNIDPYIDDLLVKLIKSRH